MQEIERKFLLSEAEFSQAIENNKLRGKYIKQYYLADLFNRTLRLRVNNIYRKTFILTFKGKSKDNGLSRLELEIKLPKVIGIYIEKLAVLTKKKSLSKVRYLVGKGWHNWELDKFLDNNEGLFLAEVELSSVDEKVVLPTWAHKEVTGNTKYYNSNLASN